MVPKKLGGLKNDEEDSDQDVVFLGTSAFGWLPNSHARNKRDERVARNKKRRFNGLNGHANIAISRPGKKIKFEGSENVFVDGNPFNAEFPTNSEIDEFLERLNVAMVTIGDAMRCLKEIQMGVTNV